MAKRPALRWNTLATTIQFKDQPSTQLQCEKHETVVATQASPFLCYVVCSPQIRNEKIRLVSRGRKRALEQRTLGQ